MQQGRPFLGQFGQRLRGVTMCLSSPPDSPGLKATQPLDVIRDSLSTSLLSLPYSLPFFSSSSFPTFPTTDQLPLLPRPQDGFGFGLWVWDLEIQKQKELEDLFEVVWGRVGSVLLQSRSEKHQ